MPEVLIRKLRQYIVILAIGIIITVATNLFLLIDNQRSFNLIRLTAISANESATHANQTLDQAQENARLLNIAIQKQANYTQEFVQHAKDVLLHANQTGSNLEAILNNTELLLELKAKMK